MKANEKELIKLESELTDCMMCELSCTDGWKMENLKSHIDYIKKRIKELREVVDGE